MGTQLQTHKKYPATHIETPSAFKPHQFALQTSVNTASQPKQTPVDLQTQLNRAKGFGHNLSQVPIHPNPPIQRQVPITRRKLYLQRSVVDEEQENDEEASRTQMKSDKEQDSLFTRLPTPSVTSSKPVSQRSLTNTNHLCVKDLPMSTQEHIQKKPLATKSAPRLHNGFETRGFKVQTKPNQSSHQQSDLKTQLSRATRFGHNAATLPTNASAPVQGKQAVQREEEPEEEPEQMKSAGTIQREEEPEEEPEQTKLAKTAQSSIQRQPMQKAASPSAGSSMPGGVRAKMEKSFGTNFSDVSIHTDSVQAKSIGALAYTQGSNVNFAPGQYKPQSRSGQSLLGHELTHVVQQRAGRVPVPQQSKGAPVNADPALEQEADHLGAKAAQGLPVQVPGASGGRGAGGTSPVQNSTKPVQFFLPGLMAMGKSAMGAMGGPAGIGGMLGQAAGGMLGGMAGPQGAAPGGAPGGAPGAAPPGPGGLMGGIGGMLGQAAGGMLGGLI